MLRIAPLAAPALFTELRERTPRTPPPGTKGDGEGCVDMPRRADRWLGGSTMVSGALGVMREV